MSIENDIFRKKHGLSTHKKTYTLFLKKKTSVCLKVKSVSVIIGKNKLIALVKSRKTFTSIPLMVWKKKHQNDLEEGDKGFYLHFSRAD